MRFVKIIWILLVSLTLTNCANRSHTGAILGSATTTAVCVEQLNTSAYLTAACAVAGAWAGANIMYNSDKDVHNAVFVDHLNNGPFGSSYTNWYNKKSGNSGIIHITRSYMIGPIKCKDYDHTIDIANQWPMIGIGNVNREVVFGTACQLPDGQWIEKPDHIKEG